MASDVAKTVGVSTIASVGVGVSVNSALNANPNADGAKKENFNLLSGSENVKTLEYCIFYLFFR